MMEAYDEEAEAIGWFGPEVAFGLIYKQIQPGQLILDKKSLAFTVFMDREKTRSLKAKAYLVKNAAGID
jgi:hypothetical protein